MTLISTQIKRVETLPDMACLKFYSEYFLRGTILNIITRESNVAATPVGVYYPIKAPAIGAKMWLVIQR